MIKVAANKFYVPAGANRTVTKSRQVANALALELFNYGYLMDEDLWSRICSLKSADALKVSHGIAKRYTDGNLNRPLFNNWEDRNFFSFSEYVVQIFGYCFQFSGNDFDSSSFMSDLRGRVSVDKFKLIKLASTIELSSYLNKILGANVPLNKDISAALPDIAEVVPTDLLPYIPSDEVRVAFLAERGLESLNSLSCKPADVLRYAAAKKDWDSVKLPARVKFANLPWSDRVKSFSFLEDFAKNKAEFLLEGMGMNRDAWSRFLDHTHFFSQKKFGNRFPNFYLAALVSTGARFDSIPSNFKDDVTSLVDDGAVDVTPTGNLAYRTFASRMNSAIEAKDFNTISILCRRRSAYIFRNFSTVLNGIHKKDHGAFVNLVRSLLPRASVDVMFSLLGINTDSEYRVIDVKGATIVEKANYSSIIKDIQGDIKNEIYNRFGYDGKVAVSDDLRDKVVPFLSKNSDLPRGTRVKLDCKHFYVYNHWVQNNRRTDLDTSAYALSKDGSILDYCAFHNQVGEYMKMSGDITNAPAPKGATEYFRVDLDKVPNSVKFIIPVINVYSGESFAQCKESRAGFFGSNSDKFNLKQDAFRYDLTSDAQANVPFIIDVEKEEAIITDYSVAKRSGRLARDYVPEAFKVAQAASSKPPITIGDLAEILSGDDPNVSLTISDNSRDNNVVGADELFSLFS